MSMGRIALVMLLGFAATGCRCVRTCVETPFPGLRTNLVETSSSGGRLRLLIVHGMSTHTQGYSAEFVEAIARKLALKPSERRTTALTNSSGFTNGFLAISDYEHEAKRLRAYELTWSPATFSEKTNQFAFDARVDKKRARLNRQMKAVLLNDGFADAVLYLSDGFRAKMQEPVTNAIHRILADDFNSHDQVVIITHSLGSKLTFDSLRIVAEEFASGDRAQAVTNFAAQTMYLIMLANQIPLLRLGETNATRFGQKRPIQQFLEMRQQGVKTQEAPKAGVTNVLRLLAVTDPNDLLSYPLQRTNLLADGTTDIQFGNVLICNTPALFGWVANPLDAHEDYFTNPKLIKLLLNGSRKKGRVCIPAPR